MKNLVVILLFWVNDALAQNIFLPDSVYRVEYNSYTNSQQSNYIQKIFSTIILCDTLSLYYINQPEIVKSNKSPFPVIIKNKRQNFILLHGIMPPQYSLGSYFYDTLFSMKWNITGKFELINKKKCLEAITDFRGRRWIAYFDPDIPFSEGPMKFGGLPGLIIRLYDENNIFKWELHSIEKIKNTISVPSIEIVGDFDTYKIIYQKWAKKFNEALNSNNGSDPNCIGCRKNKITTISMEPIYEPIF